MSRRETSFGTNCGGRFWSLFPHKERLQQKHTNATQLSFTERALLQEHNRFLAEINNEAKVRRSTKSEILGTARVMSYEDLEKARAERAAKEAAKEAKKAEKKANKAAKEAKKVASATPEAEEATAAKGKRGRKRKSPIEADAPEVDAPEVDASESGKRKRGQKRKSPEEAGTPEPKAKFTRMSEAQVEEDEIAPEPWRAPVARMW
jgi:hypothetical protein